jgi:uncharacterized membrane protein
LPALALFFFHLPSKWHNSGTNLAEELGILTQGVIDLIRLVGWFLACKRSAMMNHANGWMNGWLGGGMWLWTVIGVLVVVLLVVVIRKLLKK